MNDNDVRIANALDELAERANVNSRRWFPHLYGAAPAADRIKHMTLGLNEEAGEVAGVIKKLTGYAPGQAAHSGEQQERLAGELADVFVYLLNLAHDVNVDLMTAYLDKERVCNARWGGPS